MTSNFLLKNLVEGTENLRSSVGNSGNLRPKNSTFSATVVINGQLLFFGIYLFLANSLRKYNKSGKERKLFA